MHISEGVLNREILAISGVISALALGLSVKKVNFEDVPKVSVMSAIFFIASFIHVPIGVTSVHLILSGLVGAFLGLSSLLAIFVALFLQGLLFGYGGLTSLGANFIIIAFPSLFGYLFFSLKSNSKIQRGIYDFLVGFVPILVSALLLSLVLALNGDEFLPIAYLAFISNLPIMIIEGIITLFALRFIKKVAPQFLGD